MQKKRKNENIGVLYRVSKQFTIFSLSFVVLFFLAMLIFGTIGNSVLPTGYSIFNDFFSLSEEKNLEGELSSVKSLGDVQILADTYYTLTVNSLSTGTVIKEPNLASYLSGTVVNITAIANPGYVFSFWIGALTGSQNPTNITMNANKIVNALFGLKPYKITTILVGNGRIIPSGNVSVFYGYDKTFLIEPDEGYKIDNVYVDGLAKGAISTYTFSDVTVNHTIEARFAFVAKTLRVYLFANPNSGNFPLTGVDLTSTVAGTTQGNINYTFYLDRADSGTDITFPYSAQYLDISEQHKTAIDIGNYNQKGTYTAKVIVEREGIKAEARAIISVGEAPLVKDLRDKPIDPNDWIKLGKDNTKRRFIEFQLQPPLELKWSNSELNTTDKLEMLSFENLILLYPYYSSPAIPTSSPTYGINGFNGNKIWMKNLCSDYSIPSVINNDGGFYIRIPNFAARVYDIYTGKYLNGAATGFFVSEIFGTYGDIVYMQGPWRDKGEVSHNIGGRFAVDIIKEWRIFTKWDDQDYSLTTPFYNGMYFPCYRPLASSQEWRMGAFNASNGNILWHKRELSSPAVDNGILYSSSLENFYALDADNGNIVWRTPVPAEFFESYYYQPREFPGVNDDYVVFFRNHIFSSVPRNKYNPVNIAVLDKRTGEIKWTNNYTVDEFNDENQFDSIYLKNLAISKDYIYIQFSLEKLNDTTYKSSIVLVVLDINDGTIVQRILLPSITSEEILFNQMIIANKQLYIYTNGTLYSYIGQNPASFAGDDQVADAGQEVRFNASNSFTSSNKIITDYIWDFGDGTTGTGLTTSHVYTNPGKYTVTLTIIDSSSQENKDSLIVDVSSLPKQEAGTSNDTKEAVFQLSDNKLLLIYRDVLSNLVYKTSIDIGRSWSESMHIASNSNLLASASKNDKIFLLFYDNTAKERKIAKIDYINGMFNINPAININMSGWTIDDDKLLLDSSGRLWWGYMGRNASSWYTLVSYSNNNGITWTQEKVLNKSSYYYPFQLILWNDKPAALLTNKPLRYRDIDNIWKEGPNFNTAGTIKISVDNSSIISTDNNNLHLVYYGGDALKYSYKDNTVTGAWSSPISIGNRLDTNPKLTTDGTKLYLYWSEYFKRIRTDQYYNLVLKEWNLRDGWKDTQTIVAANRNFNHDIISVSKLNESFNKIPFVWFQGRKAPYKMFSRSLDLSEIECTINNDCSFLNTVCSYGVCNVDKCERRYNISGTPCPSGTCDGNGNCVTSCTPNLVNTTWTNWVNVSSCVNGFVNQSRNKTQYDANRCGSIANQTFYEYRLEGCTNPGCTVDSDCALGNYCSSDNCYLNEDVNHDTYVDISDLVTVAQNIGRIDCGEVNLWCERKDVDHSFEVDLSDLVRVARGM